jgi:hypothetical protein
MKAISIWQPWASLIISGRKSIETRSWPCVPMPFVASALRAATKAIGRQQRLAMAEEAFRLHYDAAELPPLDELPMGCILGTVIIEGCRSVDSEMLQDLDLQESAFGWYEPGRFAWELKDPRPLATPDNG